MDDDRKSIIAYLAEELYLLVKFGPHRIRPAGIVGSHAELQYLFGYLLEDDSLVMLAETFHAHAIYERGAPSPILGRHIPFAAAEAECCRRRAAKVTAAEVFYCRAHHGLHGARTSAGRGGQASAACRTTEISQVRVSQPDEPTFSEYSQFGDNLIECRDVGRHFHRPSMAHSRWSRNALRSLLNDTRRAVKGPGGLREAARTHT